MLTTRLRELEAAGAVTRVAIEQPIPGTLYQLTGRGRELADLAVTLGSWGMPLLPERPERGKRVNVQWALQTMCGRYTGGAGDLVVHVTIDGEQQLTVTTSDTEADLAYGHIGEPTHTIDTTRTGFFALVPGVDARPSARTVVTGQKRTLERLFRALPLRDHTAA